MTAAAEVEPIRPAVVIPTYQRRELVGRAIACALAQDPLEVLVVDDGSTDGTDDFVRSTFPQVRYLRQDNAGASAARNTGVHATSAEWVAFLDSDDVWREGHLRRLVDAIRATDLAADLYFADSVVVSDGRMVPWFDRCGFRPEGPFQMAPEPFRWAMYPYQPMFLQACVVRRSAWLAIGGLREDLPTREDTHAFLRLSLNGGLCAVNTVGVEVTADSAPGVRLTELYDPDSAVYNRATITLYEDVLGAARHVTPRYRRQLRRRLSDAYWRLGRAQVREAHRFRAAGSLAAAITAHPGAVAARLARRVGPAAVDIPPATAP